MAKKSRRPYFRATARELAEAVDANPQCKATLEALLAELQHRTKPKATELRSRVQEMLRGLVDESAAAPPPDPANPLSEPETSDDSSDREESRELFQAGTIRRRGEASDAPSRRVFARSDGAPLQVPADASKITRFRAALETLVLEMKEKRSGVRQIQLERGEYTHLDGKDHGYSFRTDESGEVFEGASVSVVLGSRSFDGKIVAVFDARIVLALEHDFGPEIHQCIVRIDNTATIARLAEQYRAVEAGSLALNTTLATQVLSRPSHQIDPQGGEFASKLNAAQTDAVRMALANPVSYIWGPPGTGKTMTLGELIKRLFDDKKKILVCSNTNQAVDQVILKLCETLKTSDDAMRKGKILRIGNKENDELIRSWLDYVDLDRIVERRSKEILVEIEVLEARLRANEADLPDLERILESFATLDSQRAQVNALTAEEKACWSTIDDLKERQREHEGGRSRLEAELEERRQSGFFRRLLLRSEHDIRTHLSNTQRSLAEASTSLEGERRKLYEAQERVAVARQKYEALSSSLAGLDRSATSRRVDLIRQEGAPLRAKLSDLQGQMRSMKHSILENARVLGATVTKTYFSPEQFRGVDAVIIDEASMVMLPALAFAAGLAREKVVISGDFLQLSPIVVSDNRHVLDEIGHDVFAECGIQGEYERHGDFSFPCMVLLDTQYRMKPEICDLINEAVYDGRLNTKVERTAPPKCPPGLSLGCITIVDTTELFPFTSRDLFKSKYNTLHAILVRNLVAALDLSETDLGVTTPYRAQAKLITRVLAGDGFSRTTASTVHRYQGDERSVMIIEFPDSVGEARVGVFLEACEPTDDGAKLLNVAVSRAKDQIIIVANLGFLDSRLPNDGIYRSILRAAVDSGTVVDARRVLELRPLSTELRRLGDAIDISASVWRDGLFSVRDFQSACLFDMRAATESIVIFSGFVTSSRVAEYETVLRERVLAGVRVRCVTRPPANNGTIPLEDGAAALAGLEAMGCVADTRWRLHEKLVVIDGKTVWFGSLNPLSHTGRTDEVMLRIENSEAADQLLAFLALPGRRDSDPTERENPVCSSAGCGSRCTYRTGRFGPYWECESCKATVNYGSAAAMPNASPRATVTVPKTLPACPECGAPTAQRNGPYGTFLGCTNFPSCRGTVSLGQRSGPQRRSRKKKWKKSRRRRR